jgi:DNA gyrase subunit B/topoisomerase-4 subunit B
MLNLPPKFVRFGDQNKTRYVTSRGEISPLLEKNFFPGIKKSIRSSPLYDNILKKIADAERDGDVRNLRNKKRATKAKISEKYFPFSKRAKNLFIVEGGSARGSILQERDPDTDAVYSLKGKIRNARRLSDLTSNAEIIDLMNILNLDPENDRSCKFERVIISTDADPDGLGHIASLIINLFYKWFPNVVRQGKLFILQTPLLSVNEGGKTKYFYSMKEFEAYNAIKKPSGVRYLKGLGSLSLPDWQYVFSNMRLLKITEDSKSIKMIEMAFGSDAGVRKKWLQS